jgi:hypothetical protein
MCFERLSRKDALLVLCQCPTPRGLGFCLLMRATIRYDLAGMPSHQIESWIAGDWDFMVNQKHVLNSPAYIREHGAPVVAIWVRVVCLSFQIDTKLRFSNQSVGFKPAGQDPEMIMRLINRIREMAGSAYIILGGTLSTQ